MSRFKESWPRVSRNSNSTSAELLEHKLDALHVQMEPFGPRVCTDWITQWQTFDHARRHRHTRHQTHRSESPEISARLPFLSPGRVIGLSRGRGIVLRQYRSKGQKNSMLTILRPDGAVTECPVTSVKEVYDRTCDFAETPTYPWCSTDTFDRLSHQLEELPSRLPVLPILTSTSHEPLPDAIVQSMGDFPCPTCPSRPACQTDFITASRFARNNSVIRNPYKHCGQFVASFQERVNVLQKFGYLTLATQLTIEGE